MSRLSRRRILRGTLFVAVGATVGALAAACGGAPSSTQPEAKPTSATGSSAASTPAAGSNPSGKTPVSITVLAWGGGEGLLQLGERAKEWNPNSHIQVTIEETGPNWEQKALAMLKAGDMIWASSIANGFAYDKVRYVESEVIQPLDDYLAASDQPDGKTLVQEILPSVKDEMTYQGKLWGIPINTGSAALQWYWEPLRAVGYDKQPETWDETLEAAIKIKNQYPAGEWTPFGWTTGIWLSNLSGLIHSATPTPFTDEGILDITGPAAMEALAWLKEMVTQGLAVENGAMQEAVPTWQRGALAMIYGYDALGSWAQKQKGVDSAYTGINIFKEKGVFNAGTNFHSNCQFLFQKAQHPQETVDFMIWALGPSNEATHKLFVEMVPIPVFSSVYDRFVKGEERYEWMSDSAEIVRKSIPYPSNAYARIQTAKIYPWLEKFVHPDSNLSAEDAMNNALQETRDEIAKQKV